MTPMWCVLYKQVIRTAEPKSRTAHGDYALDLAGLFWNSGELKAQAGGRNQGPLCEAPGIYRRGSTPHQGGLLCWWCSYCAEWSLERNWYLWCNLAWPQRRLLEVHFFFGMCSSLATLRDQFICTPQSSVAMRCSGRAHLCKFAGHLKQTMPWCTAAWWLNNVEHIFHEWWNMMKPMYINGLIHVTVVLFGWKPVETSNQPGFGIHPEVLDEPIYYVVNAYMVFFGAVTMVTESDPSFITQLHDSLLPVQKWMHEWAKGLTMLWGRGLFYVFQGLPSHFSWLINVNHHLCWWNHYFGWYPIVPNSGGVRSSYCQNVTP